jgi:hypothetical protein
MLNCPHCNQAHDISSRIAGDNCQAAARDSLLKRFWGKVDKSGDCWLWLGYSPNGRYGALKIDGKRILAHRIAYALTYGSVPDELDVLHRCDNTKCVNPSHLFLGTHTDNMGDMMAKGRGNKIEGDAHPSAKLTSGQVTQIRSLYAEGSHSQRALAHTFGVSRRAIQLIIIRRNWRRAA